MDYKLFMRLYAKYFLAFSSVLLISAILTEGISFVSFIVGYIYNRLPEPLNKLFHYFLFFGTVAFVLAVAEYTDMRI